MNTMITHKLMERDNYVDGQQKITIPLENQQSSIPLHNISSEPTCLEPLVDNQIPTILFNQSSPEKDFIENIQIKTEDERTEENEKMVLQPQIKNQNYRIIQNNAQMFHLVSPKSALQVFSELFHNVQIKLQRHPKTLLNCISYTATLEIEGKMYIANDISRYKACEKACEKSLRNMFAENIRKLSEGTVRSFKKIKLEDRGNDTPNAFPWEEFLNLAMHKLIIHWEIPNASKAFNDEKEKIINDYKREIKMIQRFPKDPSKHHPVQLLTLMKPDVEFKCTLCPIGRPSTKYQMRSVIDGVEFVGIGRSKMDARKECSIKAIKHFWKFDFHTNDEYCIDYNE